MPNRDNKTDPDNTNPAVNLIRQKVSHSYQEEPDAKTELAEASEAPRRSKHQEFMYHLSTSGKSLAEIQTAWHDYYAELPDQQKHEVWQEFYAEHTKPSNESKTSTISEDRAGPDEEQLHKFEPQREPETKNDSRNLVEIKDELLRQITAPRHATKRQHIKSLIFGLGLGSLVVIVLLFSFFNERFIAPFITPSRSISSTSIIIDPLNTAVGTNSEIIIPKINVEVPVDFDETTIDEKVIQKDLENGVIHYASTSYPGQTGNGAIFGHSSNNIFNKGKYKFAFVLLKRLEPKDTFIIQYHGKRYYYEVYDKKIVKPTDLSVLDNTDKPATFALITCDPPGTSLNRLIVWGQQISPDTTTNTASTANKSVGQPKILPSNAPSLWQRFTGWF